MNEKRLFVEDLIAAYNREKNSDVVKRLMLVILWWNATECKGPRPRSPWAVPDPGA